MSDEIRTAKEVVVKTSAEVLKKFVDFSDVGLLDTGETISSVSATDIVPASPLTCTSPTPSGQGVIVTLANGTALINYKVTLTCLTSGGQTIHAAFHVYVGNP